MGAERTWKQTARSVGVALALAASVSGPMSNAALPSLPGFGGGNDKNDACAAERAPILERKKQYDALRRSQIASAVGEGLKKGAVFFAGAMLSKYGLGGGDSGGGGIPGIPHIPGFGGGSAATAANTSGGGIPGFGGMGALLSGNNLAAAAHLQIPGVTLAPNGSPLAGGAGGDTRAIAAIAVVVAIAGTVEAYVQLKAAAANGDRFRLAQSIDDDAGLQVDVSHSIDAEEQALAACRARQVTDLRSHMASASNDSDRHALARQRTGLEGEIKQDVDLTGGVVGQQVTLAKTFTQGRAMSESRSEADVLGGQAPAYADKASTTALQLPAAAVNPSTVTSVSNTSVKPAAPSPPSFTTTRAVMARAGPAGKSKTVKPLAAGVTLAAVKDPAGAEWVELDLGGGSTGYVRVGDLTRVKGPHLAAPSNIREHNRAVLAARTDGPDRLKTLLTDVQARRAGRHLLAANPSPLHDIRRG